MSRFDTRALRAGASVCLVFAVPFSLLARWAADSDRSGLAVLLVLGSLAGFVIGAGTAAWSQDRGLPFAHGIVTASLTYLAAQTVFIALRLLLGRDVRWGAVLFNLPFVVFAGLLGGLLGAVLRSRGLTPGFQARISEDRSDT